MSGLLIGLVVLAALLFAAAVRYDLKHRRRGDGQAGGVIGASRHRNRRDLERRMDEQGPGSR